MTPVRRRGAIPRCANRAVLVVAIAIGGLVFAAACGGSSAPSATPRATAERPPATSPAPPPSPTREPTATPTLIPPPRVDQSAPTTCPAGCVGESAHCQIKGAVSSKGDKVYYLKSDPAYDTLSLSTSKGERWFCTTTEAELAGWHHLVG